MSIISRLGNIIKGKANKALDNMEDPTEQLDLSIQQKKEKNGFKYIHIIIHHTQRPSADNLVAIP